MSKDIEFLNKEKETWGKVYTDITYAISEISPFIDEKNLKRRRYYLKVDILKEYINKINYAGIDSKKKFSFNIFKDDEKVADVKRFKKDNYSALSQLKNCSKCQCLSCAFECKFKSCSACKEDSAIKSCDKDIFNVRIYKDFTQDLTNDDTGESNKYKVLAVVENCEIHRLYILLENMYNQDEKLILHYYPGIKTDNYGEITDPSEFDSVVQAYQQADY